MVVPRHGNLIAKSTELSTGVWSDFLWRTKVPGFCFGLILILRAPREESPSTLIDALSLDFVGRKTFLHSVALGRAGGGNAALGSYLDGSVKRDRQLTFIAKIDIFP